MNAPQFPFLIANRSREFLLAGSMTGTLPTIWTPHARMACRFASLDVAAQGIVRFNLMGIGTPAAITDAKTFEVAIPSIESLRAFDA